jgi:hypothetical protein
MQIGGKCKPSRRLAVREDSQAKENWRQLCFGVQWVMSRSGPETGIAAINSRNRAVGQVSRLSLTLDCRFPGFERVVLSWLVDEEHQKMRELETGATPVLHLEPLTNGCVQLEGWTGPSARRKEHWKIGTPKMVRAARCRPTRRQDACPTFSEML